MSKVYHKNEAIADLMHEISRSWSLYNIMLFRQGTYTRYGRVHTKAEAKVLDEQIMSTVSFNHYMSSDEEFPLNRIVPRWRMNAK